MRTSCSRGTATSRRSVPTSRRPSDGPFAGRSSGDGIEPIVERPETAFWPAIRAAFDRAVAIELVEEAFPFTGPLGRHRDAFVFAVELDPGEFVGGPFAAGLPTGSIEYTDEAIRAMEAAERRIVRETKAEVGRRFDGDP